MRRTMLTLSPILRPVCAGIAALAACVATPALGQAQGSYPGIAVYAETPSAALARNVRLLGSSPRSFEALIGAGRAALQLGDTQAAVGFFGRAEEVNHAIRRPRPDRRRTGGDGGAQRSPRLFRGSGAAGANQASIGADRGLAYDLTGEPARAQADYRAALYGQDRDEARRRLALSLAMGKDRAGALAAIAPLMSRRDPATERVRAFVLAMVGDVAGAKQVVEAAMPGSSAHMEPFLAKLARMSPDQQVAAVHFGRFPDDSAIRLAAVTPPPVPGPATRYPVTRSTPPKARAPAQAKAAGPQRERVYYVPFDNRVRQIVSKPVTAKPPATRPVAATPIKPLTAAVSPGFTDAPPPAAVAAPCRDRVRPRASNSLRRGRPAGTDREHAVDPLQPQPPPVEWPPPAPLPQSTV